VPRVGPTGARRQGIPPCGFVSPACFENGIKIGIDLVEIHTGERRRLAWPRPEETKAPVAGLSTGAWQFDAATLQWANRSLAKLPPGRLLIIDELGPLELRTNRGLTSGLKLVDERKYLLSLVVIRPALLAAARERWPWGEPLDASRFGAERKGNPS